jgi:hypothetical protein
VVYTNSAGEFFLRAKHPELYRISILSGEFLLPGQWEIVSAPAQVSASEEDKASPVRIVLRPITATQVPPAVDNDAP